MAKKKEITAETILEKEIENLNRTIRDKNKVIKQKDKVIKQLKGEAKQAMDVFVDSEHYLREVTDGKPLSEIMNTVKNKQPLRKGNEPCPKCGSKDIAILIYTGFHIKACDCGYRKKVNEEQEIENP